VQKPSAPAVKVVPVRDEQGTAGSNPVVDTPAVAVEAVAETEPPVRPVRSGPPGYRGTLIVTSRPRGANVFVNGEWEGETPLVLRGQRAGSRAVRLDLDGYTSWSSGVQVVADRSTTVTATLRRDN
jgi:hypothetical protein